MNHVEFTIEPFVEGSPGRHVTAPAKVLREHGVNVEIGPFGTSCVVADDDTAQVVSTVVNEALRHGADRISIEIRAGGAAL
ncbi:MAG: hypothetical protein CSA55_04690 [Ilumatobacter coccineus]|uniref:Thiamine-binding protein domain-containing protein n=1 Tax=Ilumatobacter coccineus TaxID=467094 RepID=A0A2G6K7Z2_9ACTN|nr:MAG: hypothetical protein CSA55_04690 [Ilumatobacter coccineus]